MADRILKPDSGNDLKLQNNGNTSSIKINDDQSIDVTLGTSSGDDFAINSTHLVVEGDTGNVGIGEAPGSWKFAVKASDASGTFYIHGSAGTIYSLPTYNTTTGNSANMYVHSDGSMYRSTSSRKYKKNIQDFSKGLSYLEKARPVTFEGTGPVDGAGTFVGFIAEEISEAGLDEIVERGPDSKEIESINYNGMIAVCVKSIQELSAKVTTLENA